MGLDFLDVFTRGYITPFDPQDNAALAHRNHIVIFIPTSAFEHSFYEPQAFREVGPVFRDILKFFCDLLHTKTVLNSKRLNSRELIELVGVQCYVEQVRDRSDGLYGFRIWVFSLSDFEEALSTYLEYVVKLKLQNIVCSIDDWYYKIVRPLEKVAKVTFGDLSNEELNMENVKLVNSRLNPVNVFSSNKWFPLWNVKNEQNLLTHYLSEDTNQWNEFPIPEYVIRVDFEKILNSGNISSIPLNFEAVLQLSEDCVSLHNIQIEIAEEEKKLLTISLQSNSQEDPKRLKQLLAKSDIFTNEIRNKVSILSASVLGRDADNKYGPKINLFIEDDDILKLKVQIAKELSEVLSEQASQKWDDERTRKELEDFRGRCLCRFNKVFFDPMSKTSDGIKESATLINQGLPPYFIPFSQNINGPPLQNFAVFFLDLLKNFKELERNFFVTVDLFIVAWVMYNGDLQRWHPLLHGATSIGKSYVLELLTSVLIGANPTSHFSKLGLLDPHKRVVVDVITVIHELNDIFFSSQQNSRGVYNSSNSLIKTLMTENWFNTQIYDGKNKSPENIDYWRHIFFIAATNKFPEIVEILSRFLTMHIEQGVPKATSLFDTELEKRYLDSEDNRPEILEMPRLPCTNAKDLSYNSDTKQKNQLKPHVEHSLKIFGAWVLYLQKLAYVHIWEVNEDIPLHCNRKFIDFVQRKTGINVSMRQEKALLGVQHTLNTAVNVSKLFSELGLKLRDEGALTVDSILSHLNLFLDYDVTIYGLYMFYKYQLLPVLEIVDALCDICFPKRSQVPFAIPEDMTFRPFLDYEGKPTGQYDYRYFHVKKVNLLYQIKKHLNDRYTVDYIRYVLYDLTRTSIKAESYKEVAKRITTLNGTVWREVITQNLEESYTEPDLSAGLKEHFSIRTLIPVPGSVPTFIAVMVLEKGSIEEGFWLAIDRCRANSNEKLWNEALEELNYSRFPHDREFIIPKSVVLEDLSATLNVRRYQTAAMDGLYTSVRLKRTDKPDVLLVPSRNSEDGVGIFNLNEDLEKLSLTQAMKTRSTERYNWDFIDNDLFMKECRKIRDQHPELYEPQIYYPYSILDQEMRRCDEIWKKLAYDRREGLQLKNLTEASCIGTIFSATTAAMMKKLVPHSKTLIPRKKNLFSTRKPILVPFQIGGKIYRPELPEKIDNLKDTESNITLIEEDEESDESNEEEVKLVAKKKKCMRPIAKKSNNSSKSEDNIEII